MPALRVRIPQVDDVVIDAPWKVTREFIDTHDITYVYHITNEEQNDQTESRFSGIRNLRSNAEKEMSVMQILFERPLDGIAIDGITEKVIKNHGDFTRQHARKSDKEKEFYKNTKSKRWQSAPEVGSS